MDITEVLMEERMDFRILNNGSFIPSIGYGTYKTGTEGETEQAVANALGVGYRLLDTAAYYGNEEAVGRGIKASSVNRTDIIITTKIWHTDAAVSYTHLDVYKRQDYTYFGGHDNTIISCYIVTSRTQTITVKYATDNSTISEAHSGRTIPWFHHEAIELIEVMFFLAHKIVAFPRFRNHHHNRMRQGTTCHVQEFQCVIEHSGVRTAVINYREYFFDVWE